MLVVRAEIRLRKRCEPGFGMVILTVVHNLINLCISVTLRSRCVSAGTIPSSPGGRGGISRPCRRSHHCHFQLQTPHQVQGLSHQCECTSQRRSLWCLYRSKKTHKCLSERCCCHATPLQGPIAAKRRVCRLVWTPTDCSLSPYINFIKA